MVKTLVDSARVEVRIEHHVEFRAVLMVESRVERGTSRAITTSNTT
jgi:hypothetical protein